MGLILSIELCQILNILHRFQGISKGLSMQTTNDLENLSNATYTLCYMVLFTENHEYFYLHAGWPIWDLFGASFTPWRPLIQITIAIMYERLKLVVTEIFPQFVVHISAAPPLRVLSVSMVTVAQGSVQPVSASLRRVLLGTLTGEILNSATKNPQKLI